MISTYFVIDGEPRPKGRPRFHIMNGHVSTYTPSETRKYEASVLKQYMEQSGQSFGESPISIHIICHMPIPKSTTKKLYERMINNFVFHTKKPDVDNLAKSILDSLNGKTYKDDSQIVSLHIEKKYSDTPRTEVWIREVCI